MQLIAPLRIEMIVDYCIFEHVPKDCSRTYRNLFITLGEKVADQYTYERGADYDAPVGTNRVRVGAPGRDNIERGVVAASP